MYSAIIGYPLSVRGYSTERGFQLSRGFVVIGDQFGFLSQPQSKTVDEYSLATFSCEVEGGVAPYSYQWKKNGANVGTNSAALSFTAAAVDKNASITVTVTDSVGTLITSTAAVLGVISYEYQLDGLTNLIRLSSPISMATNDRVVYDFRGASASPPYGKFIGSENFSVSVDAGASGSKIRIAGPATALLDGNVVLSDTTNIPIDALLHNIDITFTSPASIEAVGGVISRTDRSLKAKIKNINFIRAAGNVVIPMDNKGQGANQLGTVGGVNATILNYNPAGWVAI